MTPGICLPAREVFLDQSWLQRRDVSSRALGGWFSLAGLLALGAVGSAWPVLLRGAADTNEGAPWPEDLFREYADADVKQGYVLREDSWKGNLSVNETKAIAYHCSAGNEYRFYLGSAIRDAKLSVHIYDDNGNLIEAKSWQTAKDGANFAGASVQAKRSATYFLIVKVEKSSEKQTPWNMGFSYK